jgi:hypothetical protein
MEMTGARLVAAIAVSGLLGGAIGAGISTATASYPSARAIATTVEKQDLGELNEISAVKGEVEAVKSELGEVKTEVEDTKKQGEEG